MYVTQITANYFLANNVKFTHVTTDPDGSYLIEVEIQDEKDLYSIYDAGRSYGRNFTN